MAKDNLAAVTVPYAINMATVGIWNRQGTMDEDLFLGQPDLLRSDRLRLTRDDTIVIPRRHHHSGAWRVSYAGVLDVNDNRHRRSYVMTIQENLRARKSLWAARTGVVFYVLWSIVHFQAAVGVFRLGSGLQFTAVQGRVYQDAWFLLTCAIAVVVIAVVLNWRNSRLGYWLNLAVAGVADVGFIVFVLVPGHAPWWPGLEGPITWVLGWAFTTYGLLSRPSASRPLAATTAGSIGSEL